MSADEVGALLDEVEDVEDERCDLIVEALNVERVIAFDEVLEFFVLVCE